jgi:hypothetical protein
MSCKEAKLIKKKVENFISPELAEIFDTYAYVLSEKDKIEIETINGPNEFVTKYEPGIGFCVDIRANDSLGGAYLKFCHKKMEKITECKLIPFRSFYRIYGTGCVLPPHIDSEDLQYSATINMGTNGPKDYCWPIYVEEDGERESILLHPGDALIYSGSRIRHGRDKFIGLYQTQLFLHYKEKA